MLAQLTISIIFPAVLLETVYAELCPNGSALNCGLSTGTPLKIKIPPRCDDDFRKIILNEHNKLRMIHHAIPLRMDNEKLCHGAQNEVERIMEIFEFNNTISPNQLHQEERHYNDNTWTLVNFGRTSWNPLKVIRDWINQGEVHDWSENYFDSKSGHFTQMVWNSTEEIGIGYTRGRTRKGEHVQMVLVRYSPPGNFLDKDMFHENVLPV